MTPKEQVLAAADIFDGDYRRGFLQGALHSPLLELAVEALKKLQTIKVDGVTFQSDVAVKALAAIEEAKR